LTWKSYDTLYNTLSSYKENGLFEIADQTILFAQECSSRDIDIASFFGIDLVLPASENVGIGKAFSSIMEYSINDIVHVLENDWVLIEPLSKTYSQLEEGYSLLSENKVDFVKYRSRINPGDPLYTLQFKDREMDSPPHLFDCVHYREHPDLDFPDKIKKIDNMKDDWYICDSKWANHTNNPFMLTKDFYIKNIAPFSGEGVDLEGRIFEWWQDQGFRVAHSDGLYTHHRIDR
jgi:hypothetical protein